MALVTFIPGLELSRSFFADAVRPIVAAEFPALGYAAALMGGGSEVLGYDSERSTDHHWGPRVMIFVSPDDLALAPRISDALGEHLPAIFRGCSTNFGPPDQIGVRLPEPVVHGEPIAHRVEIYEVRSYFIATLGFDPLEQISVEDWLMTPTQMLLEATAGAVFRDDIGQLKEARSRLTWYPREVWLYIMACQWMRIA